MPGNDGLQFGMGPHAGKAAAHLPVDSTLGRHVCCTCSVGEDLSTQHAPKPGWNSRKEQP